MYIHVHQNNSRSENVKVCL